MTREPLVSILVPAYNSEPWIADTLHSALSQTWHRTEIVVVDDGSSDATLAVAKRFESTKVKVVTQPNSGAATARNRAYSLCQGDYIQWLDADDLLAPDKIAKQLEALSARPSRRTLLSGAFGHFNYRQGKTRFSPTSLWCTLSPIEWLNRKFETNSYIQTGAWLVSRDLSDAAGPWDTRLSLDDDGEYFCRVVLKSDLVQFVPEAKIHYRLGLSGLSGLSFNDKKWESQFLSIERQIAHLNAVDGSDRARNAAIKCLQDYLFYYYPERQDLVERSEQLARSFGGTLTVPRMPPKYVWIQKLCGVAMAKRVQLSYNRTKMRLSAHWDRVLHGLEKRGVRKVI
jgi:glycosyltransferase involved in cell wall biosynthesis